MAFPLDIRTELQIGGMWTDVSTDVRVSAPMTITRGAGDEASSLEHSTCEFQLNNRHGRYSPRNPTSPYYGLIGRNTPIRVSVPGPESYLQLDGTTASYARTPDAAALDITGDLDLRVEATCDWHAAQGQALLGKWISATNQRSYLLRLLNGTLILNWSVAGTASIFAQRPLPQLPRRAAVRATMDVDNGSGGFTVAFYWAPTMAGPWTPVGDPISSTPAVSIHASTAPLEVAPIAATGVPPVRGIVHRAEVRSGINGTLVAAPDVRALAPGATGWSDSAGRAWTLGPGAAIDDRAYRFHGEISSWPARWDVSGEDVYVPVEASGTTRRLGQGQKALASTLRRRIPSAPSLLAYWPMEESATAGTQAYSPVPGVQPLTLTGADWATDDTLGGSAPLPSVKNPTSLFTRVPSATAPGWQIEWVYNLPTLPAVQTEVLRLTIAGATMRSVVLYASSSAIRLETLSGDGTVIGAFSLSTTGALATFASKWNRLAIYSGDYGGGASLITATWRDVTTNQRYYLGTAPTTGQGRIASVSADWGAALEGMSLGHMAIFTTPGTGVLDAPPTTTIFEGADDGFLGESSLARVARLGAEEAATVDLVGHGSDYPDRSTRLGPQRPDTLLNLLEEIQDADGGILYERRDRTGLVYRDRRTLYNQPVALALNYTAPGEVPPPLEPVEDDQRLRNDVTVTRNGGTSARSVVTTGPLSVQPPPAGVGPYDEALSLSLYSDSQPAPIAQWRTHLGTWDEARYPTITVWLHAAPHLVDDALAMDIGDRLQVSNPPPWLPPDTIDQHVLGYTEVLGQYEWTMAMNCIPARPWQVGVVEDLVLGRADTDGSELTSGVTDTATLLPVTVTAGPAWVRAAAPLNANPTFEQDLTGWAGQGAAITRVQAPEPLPFAGDWAMRIVPDGAAQYPNAGSDAVPVAEGAVYTASGWLRSATARGVALNTNWFGAGGAYLATSSNDVTVPAETWTWFSLTVPAPAGALSANLAPTVADFPPSTDVLWAHNLTLRPVVPDGDPGQFPFSVTLGGEEVTVAGITGVAEDGFERTATAGWGAAGSGQTWALLGGPASDYAVTGGTGRHIATAVSTIRHTLLPVTAADQDLRFDWSIGALPVGDNAWVFPTVRATDATHMYVMRIQIATTGTMTLTLRKRNGAEAQLGSAYASGLTCAPGTWYTARLAVTGSTLAGKLWQRGTPEPAAWQLSATDGDLTLPGSVGCRSLLSAAATNTLPLLFQFDNVYSGPQQMAVARSVNSITKSHSAGTPLSLTHPMRAAL